MFVNSREIVWKWELSLNLTAESYHPVDKFFDSTSCAIRYHMRHLKNRPDYSHFAALMLLWRMSAGFDLSLNCCDFFGTIFETAGPFGAMFTETMGFCYRKLIKQKKFASETWSRFEGIFFVCNFLGSFGVDFADSKVHNIIDIRFILQTEIFFRNEIAVKIRL